MFRDRSPGLIAPGFNGEARSALVLNRTWECVRRVDIPCPKVARHGAPGDQKFSPPCLPRVLIFHYSVRSARIGSVEAARRAGKMLAIAAQTPNETIEPPRTTGSQLRTWKSCAAIRRPAQDRERDANDQSDGDLQERTAQYQTQDVHAVGAQRHAHADLRGPPHHAIGGEAIEPDGRQQQGDEAEGPRQIGDHALLIEVGSDLLLKGLDVDDGQRGIDFADRATDLRLEALGAAARPASGCCP